MTENANLHHFGHRKRLRTRLITQGKAALADYEILEAVTFAASSRGDTKGLAKGELL